MEQSTRQASIHDEQGRNRPAQRPRRVADAPAENSDHDRDDGQLYAEEWHARVARKAFELFEQRGGEPGYDCDDWLEAERLVKEEVLCEKEPD